MNSPEATRVLIVEDEQAAREASKRYLDRHGYAVCTAANASDALKMAEECAPNVVVCDWHLGDGPDGTEVARNLQSRYRIPVIFVSAYPTEKLRRQTRDIEVSRYLRKPFRLSMLADAISQSVT